VVHVMLVGIIRTLTLVLSVEVDDASDRLAYAVDYLSMNVS
jgi:hypothetical protein